MPVSGLVAEGKIKKKGGSGEEGRLLYTSSFGASWGAAYLPILYYIDAGIFSTGHALVCP